MKIAILLVALFACAFAFTEREYAEAFYKWQTDHGKVYKSFAESKHRYSVFRYNYDFVNTFDSETRGFTVAINEFADQTAEEFSRWACGMNVSKVVENVPEVEVGASVPAEWDWRQHGAVTQIKNQGQCGSCWSFSATGSTEGAYFLGKGRLVALSEQNLVDCSTSEGNQGCNGGLMDQAFQYIIKNNGIDTEASYPYTATGPNTCRFNRNNVGATISTFTDVASGSESALLNAVALKPVSVAIDASHSSFQFYSGGVYNEPACSSTALDHGVLAIGWGTESGTAYWLVKNSWGTGWGMSGYINMSRNRGNQCGIATAASYPTA
jgi:cathepsin L